MVSRFYYFLNTFVTHNYTIMYVFITCNVGEYYCKNYKEYHYKIVFISFKSNYRFFSLKNDLIKNIYDIKKNEII